MENSAYIGKTVLIGMAWYDGEDELVDQAEFVATIREIDDQAIRVLTSQGKELDLPPATGALQEAEPGEYTLRTTLEIVRDPDFVAVYTHYV
jgi:hypothetical protein